MVSILNGIDPSGITYTVSKIRDHLIKGFENQNITVICLLPVMINGRVRRPPNGPNKYIYFYILSLWKLRARVGIL